MHKAELFCKRILYITFVCKAEANVRRLKTLKDCITSNLCENLNEEHTNILLVTQAYVCYKKKEMTCYCSIYRLTQEFDFEAADFGMALRMYIPFIQIISR
ncbi:hypothetical protein CWI37_0400p0010 [Hamiltosporidium tvaerminnensis]|uniref:Uncharacterized protein n=1 Tax=Hamiltosporidium tvaerminnensis TaxID=1176355 RepID=A0A4Q9L5K7_9MICR|nr:hypothetical protein CWI37_0400p0010 [Hamiltosporidium tvaerminnensis]